MREVGDCAVKVALRQVDLRAIQVEQCILGIKTDRLREIEQGIAVAALTERFNTGLVVFGGWLGRRLRRGRWRFISAA